MGIFRTFDADSNVRTMARDLQDRALLTRIEGGELAALEAKYHLHGLSNCNKKQASLFPQAEPRIYRSRTEGSKIEARAFVELITHVENSIENV